MKLPHKNLVLAGVTVQQTPRRGTQQDMIIDQFLIGAACRRASPTPPNATAAPSPTPANPSSKLSLYPGANPGSKELTPISEDTLAPDQNRPPRSNVSDQ